MAWATTSRDGDDVCGCRMAAIDCVIMVALFDANGLTASDKEHNMAEEKNLPKARSTRVSSTVVKRLANDKVVKCGRMS